MGVFSCDKKCPKRQPGCQGTCEKYKREAAKNEIIKQKRRMEQIANSYEASIVAKKMDFAAKEKKRRP